MVWTWGKAARNTSTACVRRLPALCSSHIHLPTLNSTYSISVRAPSASAGLNAVQAAPRSPLRREFADQQIARRARGTRSHAYSPARRIGTPSADCHAGHAAASASSALCAIEIDRFRRIARLPCSLQRETQRDRGLEARDVEDEAGLAADADETALLAQADRPAARRKRGELQLADDAPRRTPELAAMR